MKNQFQFISTILQCGIRMSICGLLVNGLFLHAQEFHTVINGVPPGAPADATNHIFRTGGPIEAGLVINGFDLGSGLLKACDVDQDGKATLGEVKHVASVCFRLWDTNSDSYLGQAELGAALKELFPAPPVGGGFGIRALSGVPAPGTSNLLVGVANSNSPDVLVAGQGSLNVRGVAAQISSEELPTPDAQLAKNIFARADANKDGLLSFQEVSDFLDKNFSQWDQSSNASLDEHEFAMAFGQLALPDGAATAPVLSQ
jgi:Ca2+-binding EF-hand superfamily protein